MEENKVVEIVEAVETEGTEKKGFFSKIGSGIKKHKKALAITAGVIGGVAVIGTVLGKVFGNQDSYDEDEEYEYEEFDEEEASEETEEE